MAGGKVADRFLSFTGNLSAAGAYLIVNKYVKRGECFTVGLQAPTPVSAYGEVVWTKAAGLVEDREYDVVEAGIKFLKIDEPDALKISEFLKSKERNKP